MKKKITVTNIFLFVFFFTKIYDFPPKNYCNMDFKTRKKYLCKERAVVISAQSAHS